MSDATSQAAAKRAEGHDTVPLTTIHNVKADGVQVFYRAAGKSESRPWSSFFMDSPPHRSCSAN